MSHEITFSLGGKTYYGIEDLILHIDLDEFQLLEKETGDEVNMYEVMWKLLQAKLLEIEEAYPE